MHGGTCPLLAASLDFQLLHVDVRVLLRVDGWPQSGGDCMAASYTGGKKGGVKFKHIQVWRGEQKSLQNNATCSSRKPFFLLKIMFSFWGELFFNKTPPHTY